jgi:hypothetical protein
VGVLAGIAIASYLGIGTVFGAVTIWSLNEDIKAKEEGENLEDVLENRLTALEKLNKIVNGKMIFPLILVGGALFWMPVLLNEISRDIGKLIKKWRK